MSGSNSSVSGYLPKPTKPSTALLGLTAVFLLMYGLFFFSAFLEDLVTGNYEGGKAQKKMTDTIAADSTKAGSAAEDTSFGVVMGLFLSCGILPLGLSGLSFYLIYRRNKKYQNVMDAWYENAIIHLAAIKNGRLLISDVAEEFQIGVAESKKHLDLLVVKNIADVYVSESGEIVYMIRGYGADHSGAEPVI